MLQRILGDQTQRGRRYLAGLVTALVLVGGGWLLWQRDRPFDAATWKDADSVSCPTGRDRVRMVEDLGRNHVRPGMTMPEVRALLGKPWSIASDRRGFGTWWVWLTGPSDGQCSTFSVRFVDGRSVESGAGTT